jgi:hypothetical protein
MNNIENYIEEQKIYRNKWRKIKSDRLVYKKKLFDSGLNINNIRKDKIYKSLLKDQKLLSKQLKHLEKKINRKRSNI